MGCHFVMIRLDSLHYCWWYVLVQDGYSMRKQWGSLREFHATAYTVQTLEDFRSRRDSHKMSQTHDIASAPSVVFRTLTVVVGVHAWQNLGEVWEARFVKLTFQAWPASGMEISWIMKYLRVDHSDSMKFRWTSMNHTTIQPYNTATSRFMTVYSLKKLEALLHIPYISILYSRHDQFAFFCCWHLSNRMNWGIEFHLSRLCAPMKEI